MILESDFPPDVRVENEARYLKSKGYTVSILCSSFNKKFSEYEEIEGIKVYRVYQDKITYKFSALSLLIPTYFRFWRKAIESFLQTHKIDVIHLHDLPLIKVVNNISKKYNLPYVADFHENRPEIMKYYAHTQTFLGKLLISNKSWQKYQKQYSKLADKLILVTPEAKEYYVKEYDVTENRVYVVPNYADIKSLKKIDIDKEIVERYSSKFVVNYFGDTGLRRGTMTIIEAAEILRKETDILFMIIGDSKEQTILQSEIKKRNLNNVELTGYLKFDRVISYVFASDIGLCPFINNIHHNTTYANKMFQTMYFAKPIIASNCKAQENLINKENAGIIFNSGNAHELAEKVLELKNNHNQYNQMAKNAQNAIIYKYNTEIGNEVLLDIYKSFEN